jgi:FMN phosphatase YigB (HAD superfamily)
MFEPKIEKQALLHPVTTRAPLKTKLVITDVDGTLLSFWDYFVPAVREFLKEISLKLEKPVDELAEDIGRIIERRGTHEYPWLLEETSFAWRHFSERPEEFVKTFVKPFWEALDSNRSKYLRPFPTVLETLEALKRKGVKIVALSDAPEYMARVRNKQVFDGLLDAVYALETVEPAPDDVWQPITLEHGRQRIREMRSSTSSLKSSFHVLPKWFEKPTPNGLDRILKEFGVFPQETLFVGDSLAKDGLLASSRGVRYIWAHYGIHLPAEYDELVHYSLKPEGSAKMSDPDRQPLIEAIAARYDEVLNHI